MQRFKWLQSCFQGQGCPKPICSFKFIFITLTDPTNIHQMKRSSHIRLLSMMHGYGTDMLGIHHVYSKDANFSCKKWSMRYHIFSVLKYSYIMGCCVARYHVHVEACKSSGWDGVAQFEFFFTIWLTSFFFFYVLFLFNLWRNIW